MAKCKPHWRLGDLNSMYSTENSIVIMVIQEMDIFCLLVPNGIVTSRVRGRSFLITKRVPLHSYVKFVFSLLCILTCCWSNRRLKRAEELNWVLNRLASVKDCFSRFFFTIIEETVARALILFVRFHRFLKQKWLAQRSTGNVCSFGSVFLHLSSC